MRKLNVIRNVSAIVVFILAALAIFGVVNIVKIDSFYKDNYMELNMESAEFEETADVLGNPYEGLYGLACYDINEDSVGAVLKGQLLDDYKRVKKDKYIDIMLIEIKIAEYTSRDITPNAVAAVDQILKFWKEHGYSIVLRFLYDWDGLAELNEPESLDQIKMHMKYLADTVGFYQEAVLTMQGIFVGNWAEMHGSKYLTPENIKELMDYQCEVFSPNIYMAVRTPSQRRIVMNSAEDIPESKAFSGEVVSRVGLFDDGMMSSESDVGTFGEDHFSDIKDDYTVKLTREEELDYQSRICQYVPNGGEICYDTEYSDIKNAIKTLRQMKITYLNAGAATDKWKSKNVKTNDAFDGMSALDYIQRHLGYRYHISTVGSDFNCYKGDTLDINIGMTNTGFAPVYKPTSGYVYIIDSKTGESKYECWLEELDLRLMNTTEEAIGVARIPKSELDNGDYTVYVKFFFNYGDMMITMANDLEKDDEMGYKICEFSVNKDVPDADLREKFDIYRQYGGR